DRARAERRGARHGRPVRRDEGAARRLLPARLRQHRRGDRLCGEDPVGGARLDRGSPARRALSELERVFREEYARVVAVLVRDLRDIDLAEDALSDAVEAALETWPRTGVPGNPGAWLTVAARRKAIDRLRRARRHAELVAQLEKEAPVEETTIPDARLALVFTCCHPALAPDA